MDTVSLINQHSSSLIQFFWTMLWQSSALILILLLLNLLLRKRVKAVFRYCLWMLLLAKLVLPVGFALPCSPAYWVRTPLPDVRKTDDAPSASQLVAANADQASAHSPIPAAPETETPAPATSAEQTPTTGTASSPPAPHTPVNASTQPPQVAISWQSLVSLGWLMAVLVMLGLLIQRALFVKSLMRQAKPAEENMLRQLKHCAVKMGMQQKVDLRISPNATSPSVCGLMRPVILIPEHLGEHLDAGQIDAILMHELAHIKRADLWVNLVQALLQIVYFYNPLLWLANTLIRRIREQAVDEMVLVAMDERAQDYPETLLTVSRLVWSKPMLSLRLIGVVESKSALSSRIKHILGRPFPQSARLGLVGVTAIFLTAAVLLPMAKGSLFRKPAIPVDTELSQVPGVSLQRVAVKTSSGTTGSSSGGQSHSRRSFKSEQALVMLRRVSKNYPVVLKAKLPKGIFAMSAEVDGDWRMLLEQVCLAFSQSFDLDISIRPHRQKVLILTCPDPTKLKLKESDRDVSCGFYKQEDVSDSSAGKRVLTYREKFIVGMDELCAFAARHVLVNSNYRQTLVNETNLDGLYEGVLTWSPNSEKQIIESLQDMGLKVSKARRTVETVVVAKRDPAKDYTVQADVLGSIRSDLVLNTHKYHPAGQPVHFSLEQKHETRVEFDKLPSMFLKIDGKEYKSNMGSNPYSGGTSSFTSNSIRGRDKPELAPGKHRVSVLFKDYDIRYRGQTRHIDELSSNECEFEVLDSIPDGYFRPVSIANAKQILDDCHIQMLYLVEPTSDSIRDYTEQMTIKGYTPPFNIAARVYVESESGKKVFIKDLAIVSTVGEVLRNNSFSHGLHKDFGGNESQFSEQDLLREKWRIVLEPSQAVAQTNAMIKRYFGQTYYGPYQDVQMHMNSFRFHDAGFTRTSHNPLSNFQRGTYRYLDMDRNRSSKESDGADLIYQTDKNCFALATHSKVSALKLNKTLSLNNLAEQMMSAVALLSSAKGNIRTIDIRDGQLDLYALQSSEGNYFLLTVNGAEHSHNGAGMGGATRYIEHSRYKDLTVEAVRTMKQSETLPKVAEQTNTSSPGETKTALLLPSIRQVLDLSTGKMLDVPLEKKSQAECLAYVNQNCAGGVMFDHDGKMSHLGFVNVTHVSRHTTVQSGIKMMSFVSKNMPQEVTVTAKTGKRYAIQISSAENEGAQISYEQLPADNTSSVDRSDWIELTIPDIDGGEAPAMLTLDTHELVAIQDDNDQRAHEQWIQEMRKTPDRSFLVYEYAQNKANLIMVKGIRFLGIDAGPSTQQAPIIQVVGKTLPDTFTMTSPDGQVYEFTVLQADSKSCRLRYRLRPGGKTEMKTETNKTPEQTENKRFGPIDFEGYFPDSQSGTEALQALWDDPKKDSKAPDVIIEAARKGLRRHRGNANILRWVGNLFIWGENPQNEKAIELMYHASGSPNRGLYGDAVYFGLSVTKDKTPEIIRALAAVAMKTDDYYNVTGRILWGCKNHKDQLFACLDPYLNADDQAIRKKAEDVKAYFRDSKAFMAEREKEQQEAVRKEHAGKLDSYKEDLLTGSSSLRMDTLKILQGKGVMSIIDESFLDAFAACIKDSDARVRDRAARLLGQKYVWGANPQNPRAIEMLMPLLDDSNREVRGTALYFGLSTVHEPDKALLTKTLATILDDREINYYGRVIWGAKRNKEAAREILDAWMSQTQDPGKAIKAYEIYEDVLQEPLAPDIARRFADKRSDVHEGLVAMVMSEKPIAKDTMVRQFIACLGGKNLMTKVSELYIREHQQTVVGMFICETLTERNAIRQALKEGPGFNVAGYIDGRIGPSGSGWIRSLQAFKKSNEPYRVELTDIIEALITKANVLSDQVQPRLSPPIIAHEVKLNFADPTVRDKSFHSKQSVAFALAFINYDIGSTGKLMMSIFGIGQTTWSLHFKGDHISIQDGSKGQEVLSEAWPMEQRKFEKVITLPLKYGQHSYDCPVHIDLLRRAGKTPIGDYWYCAYLSGRLPKGAGRRMFEIVNLDQQMEFRLIGDGTDQRDAVLGIDIDGDGTINAQKTGGEQFSLYEPFQIGSKTYRVTEIDPYMPRVVFREVETP